MKLARARRRAMSSICGFRPRFSWMTIIPGNFVGIAFRVSALTGRTRYPLMIPFPCGDGTGCRRKPAHGQSLHVGHKFTPPDLTVNKEVIQLYRLTRQSGFLWLHLSG